MTKKIEKLYIFSIIAMPILFQYSIGISTVTVGDTLLIISTLLLIIFKVKELKGNFQMIMLFIYIVTVTVCRVSINNTFQLGTTMRYLLYLFSLSFASNIITEWKIATKIYQYVALISAIYLIVQVIILNTTGYYLPGQITILPLTDKSLYTYTDIINEAQVKRCMAFFGEPSHFAIYILGFFTIFLFKNFKITRKNIIIAIILSLSLVLSTSITGMLVLGGIWIIWIITQFNSKKINLKKFLGILLILIIFLCAIYNTSAVKYFLNKNVFARQSEGRFKGFEYISNYLKEADISQKIIGNGMLDNVGNVVYLSGYPRLIYYFGFIGFLVYIFIFISLYKKTDIAGKMLIVVLAVLSFGAEIIFSNLVVPYIFFIINFIHKKEYEKNIDKFMNKEEVHKI